MEWYYTKQGVQSGPVDENQLRQIAQRGELQPNDMVWNQSMGSTWAPASTVPGLFPPNPTSPPPFEVVKGSYSPGLTPNRDLMAMARNSLKNRWGVAVGITLLFLSFFLVIGLAEGIPQGIASYHSSIQAAPPHQAGATHASKVQLPMGLLVMGYLLQLIQRLITGPLYVGFCSFFLKLARHSEVRVSMLFGGFLIFWKAFLAYFFVALFTLLWMLLLIIPGIIAAYSYSMTFFILADDPSVRPFDAIRRSKEMMRGHKWKLFFLQLRFIGWFLLTLLTCGLGILWLSPYYSAALAHFYDDVRPRES